MTLSTDSQTYLPLRRGRPGRRSIMILGRASQPTQIWAPSDRANANPHQEVDDWVLHEFGGQRVPIAVVDRGQ